MKLKYTWQEVQKASNCLLWIVHSPTLRVSSLLSYLVDGPDLSYSEIINFIY